MNKDMNRPKDSILVAYFTYNYNSHEVRPIPCFVPNDLIYFQHLVGGLIEHVSLTPEDDLICNEEAKLLNMREHALLMHGEEIIDTINGPFFICGHDDEGNLIDISDTALEKFFYQYSHMNDDIIPLFQI